MEKYIEITLRNTKNIYDELKVIHTRVLAYIAQIKPVIAIKTVLDVLTKLGITFPKRPNLFHVLVAIIKIKVLLFVKKIRHQNIVDLPEMTDRNKKEAVRFLSLAYAPAYFADQKLFPLLILETVILSLRF